MIAVDTNTIVYAVDKRDPTKNVTSAVLMADLAVRDDVVIPLQVLGELSNALRRRVKVPGEIVSELVSMHLQNFHSFQYNAEDVLVGNELANRGVSSFWDGVLLASCERFGCKVLISEDMNDGFMFGALEIVSPFAGAGARSPRLAEVLIQ
ncbi:MAG: PIN domain-containing protein [Pseudomonadota bacterium]